MDVQSMKNIVILKNLPSNMVEEAFVVLKDNVKMDKSKVRIEKKDVLNKKDTNIDFDKNYVVKEAEFIVSDYLKQFEEKEDKNYNEDLGIKYKYKKQKRLSIFLGLFSLFCIISMLLR